MTGGTLRCTIDITSASPHLAEIVGSGSRSGCRPAANIHDAKLFREGLIQKSDFDNPRAVSSERVGKPRRQLLEIANFGCGQNLGERPTLD